MELPGEGKKGWVGEDFLEKEEDPIGPSNVFYYLYSLLSSINYIV